MLNARITYKMRKKHLRFPLYKLSNPLELIRHEFYPLRTFYSFPYVLFLRRYRHSFGKSISNSQLETYF